MRKYLKRVITLTIIGLTVYTTTSSALVASATTASELQNIINQHQNELDQLTGQIANLEDEQDILEEQIDDLNAEIVNIIASIDLKEEEISQKKAEIADKQIQINNTEAEYFAAVTREESQRESMVEWTRLMYENGDAAFLEAILDGKGFSDILNRMDYVERMYEYSLERLNAYIEVKDQVHALWDRLEEEKTGLELAEAELETDRTGLEELKSDLNAKLDKKKKESANYEAEIKKARKMADATKKQLQQDKQKLKQLQAAENAANMKYAVTNYTSTIDNATGSDLGKKVAKYACQFIGNPYVMGGTSLTKGADCSGFTYRIYQDFGYSIPRTSSQQRSAGTGVAYSEAQPGDLICYDGHVGMYIGGGLIVHASSAKTGIKVSQAQYRTILAVRRIIN